MMDFVFKMMNFVQRRRGWLADEARRRVATRNSKYAPADVSATTSKPTQLDGWMKLGCLGKGLCLITGDILSFEWFKWRSFVPFWVIQLNNEQGYAELLPRRVVRASDFVIRPWLWWCYIMERELGGGRHTLLAVPTAGRAVRSTDYRLGDCTGASNTSWWCYCDGVSVRESTW